MYYGKVMESWNGKAMESIMESCRCRVYFSINEELLKITPVKSVKAIELHI